MCCLATFHLSDRIAICLISASPFESMQRFSNMSGTSAVKWILDELLSDRSAICQLSFQRSVVAYFEHRAFFTVNDGGGSLCTKKKLRFGCVPFCFILFLCPLFYTLFCAFSHNFQSNTINEMDVDDVNVGQLRVKDEIGVRCQKLFQDFLEE